MKRQYHNVIKTNAAAPLVEKQLARGTAAEAVSSIEKEILDDILLDSKTVFDV